MKSYGYFLPYSLLVVICFLVSVSQSYDDGHYATPSDSGYGRVQSGGSAYHYHVPLVGQNYHPQPPPYYHQQPQSSHHEIYLVLAAFALLAIPLLFLTLLPLLLLPLGLPILLALLMPMPMMMMMMMEMMMMSPAGGVRAETHLGGKTGTTAMRSLKDFITNDLSSLLTNNSFSDLQMCDSRIVCELGASAKTLSGNSTQPKFDNFFVVGESLMNFVQQTLPQGKSKNVFQTYKNAFFQGVNWNNCLSYECPFRHFNNNSNLSGSAVEVKNSLDSVNSVKHSKYWDGESDKKRGKNMKGSALSISSDNTEKRTPLTQSNGNKFYVRLLGTPTIKL